MSLPRQLLQYRYTALAVAIAFLAALFPLLGTDDVGHIAWTASLWCVLVAAIRSLSEPRSPLDRLARVLGWVAVAASASSLWCFSTADQGHGLAYFIIHSLTLAFLLALLVRIILDVFGHSRVSVDTLVGAACAYILLGLVFAFLLLVAHSLGTSPVVVGDAAEPSQHAGALTARYLYFSFVTLSTLGYGDLVPASSFAQLAAPAEAILGQLFLAVFIARLIGVHVASSHDRAQHPPSRPTTLHG